MKGTLNEDHSTFLLVVAQLVAALQYQLQGCGFDS
jgi:hypothetical protein